MILERLISLVLVGADGVNLLDPGNINNPQVCGGYINTTTHSVSGYIQTNGQVTSYSKGYICSLGQVCIVGIAFYLHFSRSYPLLRTWMKTLKAACRVSITFYPLCYRLSSWPELMGGLRSCIRWWTQNFSFPACSSLRGPLSSISGFWTFLLQLSPTRSRPFAKRPKEARLEPQSKLQFSRCLVNNSQSIIRVGANFDDQEDVVDGPRLRRIGWILKSYRYTTWFWVALALTSLGFQASRTSTSSNSHINLLSA